jgi:hypothetical protein
MALLGLYIINPLSASCSCHTGMGGCTDTNPPGYPNSGEPFLCQNFNPLSAMVAIWRHIMVSCQVFGTERVHWNLDIPR